MYLSRLGLVRTLSQFISSGFLLCSSVSRFCALFIEFCISFCAVLLLISYVFFSSGSCSCALSVHLVWVLALFVWVSSMRSARRTSGSRSYAFSVHLVWVL